MVGESIVKSIVLGFPVGLVASIVIAVATLFTDFNGLWLALGALPVITAVAAVAIYFSKLRVSEKAVAERLDRMGYEERFITMQEYADDKSIMAEMQRNDTEKVLAEVCARNGGSAGSISGKQKREALGFTVRNIITVSVVAAVAVVSMVFTGLPPEKLKSIFVQPAVYTIEISAGEFGYLVNENDKYIYNADSASKLTYTVNEGDSSAKAVVTARDDIVTTEVDKETGEEYELRHAYIFSGWSDGYYDEYNAASRFTEKADAGYSATAQYREIELEKDLGAGGGGGGSGNSGDGESDVPPPPDSDQKPDGDGDGDGNPPPPSDDDSDNNGANHGDDNSNNNIIDGNTPYGEHLPDYIKQAIDGLANGEELPPALRKLIESYMGSL